MRVCAVTGPSGSGKTTLIEKLIRKLSGEGLRIAYVKHSHHPFTLSPEGKDTSRALDAGAEVVRFSGKRSCVELRRGNHSFKKVINRLVGVDLVLVEGFASEDIPSIEIVHSYSTGKMKGKNVAAFAAVDGGGHEEGVFGLNDIEGIARFLIYEALEKQGGKNS